MATFFKRIATPSVFGWLISLLCLLPTFSITQCRADQETTPPPVLVFVLDISDSMNDRIPIVVQPTLTTASKLSEILNRMGKHCSELPDGARVLITVFDHERREVCDILLRTKEDRNRLAQAVNSIKTRKGSTHLWRSVDQELTRVSKLVASTSQRARVIVYSDGEDMEKNKDFSYKTVLDKHGPMIQSSLNLDWVTLGYDLAPTVKREFESVGANVVRVVTLEQLVPLHSDFHLSSFAIKAGQSVTISDSSTGIEISSQRLDLGGGRPVQHLSLTKGRFHDVSVVFERPGTFQITLETETKDGRKDTSRRSISVTKQSWAMPSIRSDVERPTINQPVRFSATPFIDGLQYKWKFSDESSLHGESVVWVPRKPGNCSVELVATDSAGESKSQSKSLVVSAPALPQFKIHVSKARSVIGDSVELRVIPMIESVRYAWIVDKTAHSYGPETRLVFNKEGIYEVQLVARGSFGQTETAIAHVEVYKPEPPKARFRLASNKLEPGQPLIAINESSESASSFVWRLNGVPISKDRNLEHAISDFGKLKLELVASDNFAQASVTSEFVLIPLPPAPTAGFTLGSKQIRIGDPLTLTHTCSGKIDSVAYDFNSLPSVLVQYPFEAANSAMEIVPTQLGKLVITQTVSGPGGVARLTEEIEVLTKWSKPIAGIRVENYRGKGRLETRFINTSAGDEITCEFNAGDGSPIQTVRGAVDIVYAYGPGTWYPSVTVHGPKDAGFWPSVWKGQAIIVAKPTPRWVTNLIWQLPIAIATLLSVVGLKTWIARRQARKDSMGIHGHLAIRPINEPLTVYDFDIDAIESVTNVSLPDDTEVKIARLADGYLTEDELGSNEFAVEIRHGAQVGCSQGRLREDEEAEIGDYTLTFSK